MATLGVGVGPLVGRILRRRRPPSTAPTRWLRSRIVPAERVAVGAATGAPLGQRLKAFGGTRLSTRGTRHVAVRARVERLAGPVGTSPPRCRRGATAGARSTGRAGGVDEGLTSGRRFDERLTARRRTTVMSAPARPLGPTSRTAPTTPAVSGRLGYAARIGPSASARGWRERRSSQGAVARAGEGRATTRTTGTARSAGPCAGRTRWARGHAQRRRPCARRRARGAGSDAPAPASGRKAVLVGRRTGGPRPVGVVVLAQVQARAGQQPVAPGQQGDEEGHRAQPGDDHPDQPAPVVRRAAATLIRCAGGRRGLRTRGAVPLDQQVRRRREGAAGDLGVARLRGLLLGRRRRLVLLDGWVGRRRVGGRWLGDRRLGRRGASRGRLAGGGLAAGVGEERRRRARLGGPFQPRSTGVGPQRQQPQTGAQHHGTQADEGAPDEGCGSSARRSCGLVHVLPMWCRPQSRRADRPSC